MNESRAMFKPLISITRQKDSLNIMKPSSHEMLENLCNEKIFQNQLHTEIGTFPMATNSTLNEICELCFGI